MRRNPFEKYLGLEDHLQHQVITWVKSQYKNLKFHHSPDAGRRTPFERYKYKYLGSDSGFPDLIFPSLKLAIELKVPPNTTTKEQDEWLLFFENIGWSSNVCYTFEAAMALIKKRYENYKELQKKQAMPTKKQLSKTREAEFNYPEIRREDDPMYRRPSGDNKELPEWVEFINCCKSERDRFCEGIRSLRWDNKTRTISDDILIMYDQLIQRYSRMEEENSALRSQLFVSERFRLEDAASAIDDQNAMRNNFMLQINSLKEENNRLREALEGLVHLHMCEQEGIGSGQPTPAQWYAAVDKASEALINKPK